MKQFLAIVAAILVSAAIIALIWGVMDAEKRETKFRRLMLAAEASGG